jgi:acetyl-CoA carboxylase biotin carboxyl carrier protein
VAEKSDWTATLQEIIAQMVQSDVTELEVRRADLRIRLRRPAGEQGSEPVGMSLDASDPGLSEKEDVGTVLHRVSAPLTGIYYASPNPSAAPYVDVGDWVDESTVVGLIETMKVFTEVMAECHGKVVEILTQQGELVHAAEPIVLVDTAAVPDSAGEVE